MNPRPILLRPAQYAERSLVIAILKGDYPPGTPLPGERDLAVALGVTRPTLRETIGRLAREGWLTIQHGRPTRVNGFFQEGGLGILRTIAMYPEYLTPEMVRAMLQVRDTLLPAAAREAATKVPSQLAEYLARAVGLPPDARAYAEYDWGLQRLMVQGSGNPVFGMIFNDFEALFLRMAEAYFDRAEARAASAEYYRALKAGLEPASVEALVGRTLAQVRDLWEQTPHPAVWEGLAEGKEGA
jgi:GntR family negative regulator for fad regulon and positive regulator of fabA